MTVRPLMCYFLSMLFPFTRLLACVVLLGFLLLLVTGWSWVGTVTVIAVLLGCFTLVMETLLLLAGISLIGRNRG